jgi:hypothetical protein
MLGPKLLAWPNRQSFREFSWAENIPSRPFRHQLHVFSSPSVGPSEIMYAFSWAEKSPVGPSCISWANGHSFRHILLGRNRLAGSSDIICWVNTKPTGQRLGPKSLAEPFRDDMDIEYPAGPIRSSFRDIYTGPIRHSQYLYPNTIGPLILLISHLADPPAWVLFQAVGPSVISYAWAHIGWPASLGRFSTFGCPTKSGNVTEGAHRISIV